MRASLLFALLFLLYGCAPKHNLHFTEQMLQLFKEANLLHEDVNQNLVYWFQRQINAESELGNKKHDYILEFAAALLAATDRLNTMLRLRSDELNTAAGYDPPSGDF